MIKGTIRSYNPRRGTGTVRPVHSEEAFPFTTTDSTDRPLREGDPVEFKVVGGMTGLMVRSLHRLDRQN